MANSSIAESRKKLGVISMDVKGLNVDNQTMANMVNLELQKADIYELLCKYDAEELLRERGVDVNECFGKSCLVRVGELLNADKMLSGSVEKFGNKIIFVLRLIDVESDRIIKTDVMEYIDQQDQLQQMFKLSVNNILDIENDKFILDLLVNYDVPITTSRTTLNLSGPRIGFSHPLGRTNERMTAGRPNGGFDMYQINCLIGYQFERRFLSAGSFQALVEFIPMITGLESGMIIPSATTMLGFRFSDSGLEFGLGPVFRLNQVAYGYYDEDNRWHLKSDIPEEERDRYDFIRNLDSRGNYRFNAGMIFAFGKTFRSGYLNIPINAYYSPRQEGSIVGLMVGFNVTSNPKTIRENL